MPIGFRDVEDPTLFRLSALCAGCTLPQISSGTHLCYRPSKPQNHSVTGRIRYIEKKFIHLMGTWTLSLNHLRYCVPIQDWNIKHTNRYSNSNSQKENTNNDEHYPSAPCKIWSNRWTEIKMYMLFELGMKSSNQIKRKRNKLNTYTFLQCGHLANALFRALNCKWKWKL
jgi:hypothetical protein